jgi:hypothetical protein
LLVRFRVFSRLLYQALLPRACFIAMDFILHELGNVEERCISICSLFVEPLRFYMMDGVQQWCLRSHRGGDPLIFVDLQEVELALCSKLARMKCFLLEIRLADALRHTNVTLQVA